MPLPGQGSLRAASNDPAETLAGTLVSPSSAAATRGLIRVRRGPVAVPVSATGSRCPAIAEPEHETDDGSDWPGGGETMKTTGARRVRPAAVFAGSAVAAPAPPHTAR